MSTHQETPRSWVQVDLSNLLHNARTVLAATPGARLLPMVKADAYGVGVRPVVEALARLEPWGFGVATPEEGVALREMGVTNPIIVFTPALQDQLDGMREADLRPVLDDPELIQSWGRPFHFEIDTGMGRAGIPWHEADRIRAVAALHPEGVFTHFHSADETQPSVTTQEKRIREKRDLFEAGTLFHAQNSAGAFRAEGSYDLVRPGIFLYGGGVGKELPAPKPVVTLRSRIVSRRTVMPGESVSYGATWTPSSTTVVATLGIGYADGVRRSVAGLARVISRGRKVPVVGRVTMDMTMIDVGPEPAEQIGDTVTLIGTDEGETISLDEFASWAGTISYEVLTGLGSRLPRRY